MAMEKGKTVGGAMKGHKVLEVTLQSLPPPLRNLAAAGSSKQVVAQRSILDAGPACSNVQKPHPRLAPAPALPSVPKHPSK